MQKDLLWQLTWRVPALEPGTVVITERLPVYFESDNSLTAPLNWTYAPDYSGGDMPYLMALVSVRTDTGVLTYEKDQPIVQDYKVATFRGNTSQSLVIWYNTPGCVRVLSPVRDARLPGLPDELRYMLQNADLSTIQNGASQPPAFLGVEPAHGWCYYFEKVDLASTMGDWPSAAKMADAAISADDHPGYPADRLVLAEAYAMTGQWQKAQTQTEEAYHTDEQSQRLVCSTWNRISVNADRSR